MRSLLLLLTILPSMSGTSITEERSRRGCRDATSNNLEELCKGMNLRLKDNKAKLKCKYVGLTIDDEPLHSSTGTVKKALTYTSTSSIQ